MNQPLVSIIVLNWNGWKDTIECLDSLSKLTYTNYRIIVVDNGSTDGSVIEIKDWIGRSGNARTSMIELKENVGYARGNNAGARFAIDDTKAKFIFILNNDTVVNPDMLEPLVSAFGSDDKVALAGPKIIDYNTGKFWQGPAIRRFNLFSYLIFLTPLYRFFVKTPLLKMYLAQGEKPLKVYGVPGCAMFFRSDHFKKIGLFDETTFLYWEEYIIAEKLLAAGLDTLFVPYSKIRHKVSASVDKIEALEKTLYTLQAEKYFQERYFKAGLMTRSFIRLVRSFIYLVYSIFDRDYRRNLSRIFGIIYGRSEHGG